MVEVVHVLGVLYTWKLTKQLYLEVYKCRQDELNYKVDYQYHTRKIFAIRAYTDELINPKHLIKRKEIIQYTVHFLDNSHHTMVLNIVYKNSAYSGSFGDLS